MQCQILPTGSTPEPVIPTTQVTPISNNARTSSCENPCNALVRVCPVCSAPLTSTRKKFCSKSCGTLFRVRALREREAPLRKLVRECNDGYQQERRSAVTDAVAGTNKLRSVGKDTAGDKQMDIERRCKKWRARIRKQFAAKRKVLEQELAAMTSAMNAAIARAERRLGRKKGQS